MNKKSNSKKKASSKKKKKNSKKSDVNADDIDSDSERKTNSNKKGRKGKGKNPRSHSAMAGLQMPVGRITRMLRKGQFADRIGETSGVYLAAVMEYLAHEVLDLAGNAARDNKVTRITPRHLTMAIKNDEELDQLVKGIISGGGSMPNIHEALQPRKSKRMPDAVSATMYDAPANEAKESKKAKAPKAGKKSKMSMKEDEETKLPAKMDKKAKKSKKGKTIVEEDEEEDEETKLPAKMDKKSKKMKLSDFVKKPKKKASAKRPKAGGAAAGDYNEGGEEDEEEEVDDDWVPGAEAEDVEMEA